MQCSVICRELSGGIAGNQEAKQKAADLESACVVFSPDLDLRSMIQRKNGSSRPFSCIILLNGLSQEIKPSVCVQAEKDFCLVWFFFFQRMF